MTNIRSKLESPRKRYNWVAIGILLLVISGYFYFRNIPRDFDSSKDLIVILLATVGIITIFGSFVKLPQKELRKEESCLDPHMLGNLDADAEKQIWEWAIRQDQYTVDQFGIGVVGIGALFFAFGQITFPTIQLLIAFIGLGGSLTLWDHMYGARQEYYRARNLLTRYNPHFSALLNTVDDWRRDTKIGRYLYHPVSRLMMYFMALVSWGWVALILTRMIALKITNPFRLPDELGIAFRSIWYASLIIIVFTLLVALYRKFVTDPKRR